MSISCLLGNEPMLPKFFLLCNNVFDTIEIVEQDVIDVISVLQVNKAVGPDCISHKMLKETIFIVSTLLCFLIFERKFISYTIEDSQCTSII